MRVLVVEDDDTIAEPLTHGLRREGFDVTRAKTGRQALAPHHADVILLDIGLPDIDGFEVARTIRRTSTVPIIMVTARGDEMDRVLGLELGSDDYVVKPFGVRELVARIRAVTRRSGTADDVPAVQRLDGLTLDRRARRVRVDGREVALTPKEFDLLAFLMTDPGAVHQRRSILESVWDPHWYGTTKTLDVHVASLRRKLGDPRWIQTVRGVGFRIAER